jgi:beta-lactamase class A
MGAYKQIEQGKLTKDTRLTLAQEHLDQRFGTLWQKGAGTILTVEEAINLTLIESDNTASHVLRTALPDGAIDHVFDSLDVPKDKEGQFYVVSPESYSSILRSLYLSSYLTRTASNEILDVLTRTTFRDKIPAGVPPDIPVAHKIGIFNTSEEQDAYSDCGIVYAPKRPYLLCIMVQGDEEAARAYMHIISKTVYQYVAGAK